MTKYYFGGGSPEKIPYMDDNLLPSKVISNEHQVNYEDLFSNKKFVCKDPIGVERLLILNIILDNQINLNEHIIDQAYQRFPYLQDNTNSQRKFWSHFSRCKYSRDFYWKYQQMLKLSGFFNIVDLDEDLIITHQDLFKTLNGCKVLLQHQHSYRVLRELSYIFTHYFLKAIEDNHNYSYFFISRNSLELSFVNELIKFHGWYSIFKFYSELFQRENYYQPMGVYTTIKLEPQSISDKNEAEIFKEYLQEEKNFVSHLKTITTIDYPKILERISIYKEELMSSCFHPQRVFRYLKDFNYDLGEDFL